MMSFLNDQDTPRGSTSNLDIQDESISEVGKTIKVIFFEIFN